MSTLAYSFPTPPMPPILSQIHEPLLMIGYNAIDNIHYKAILPSPFNVTPMMYMFRAEHSGLDNLSEAGLVHGKC